MADNKLIPLIKALGQPSAADITTAVDAWLDDHPEATTTVQDGSITKAKLDSSLQGTVDDVADLKSESTEYKLTKISDTVTTGKYISSAQNTYGQLIDVSSSPTNWEITDYVDVSGCNHVAITAACYTNRLYYCFYDSGKAPIAGSGKAYVSGETLTDEIVAVPANAKYCVAGWYISTASNDPIIKKAEVIPKISDDSVTTSKIKDGAVTEEKIVSGLFIKAIPSKNLFNIDAISESAVLAYNSNQTSASTSYDTSDFIPVKAGKSYTISPKCRIYCLSTGLTAGTVTVYNNDDVSTARTITPSYDGYLRISYAKGTENVQVEEGNEATAYVPYGSSVGSGIKMNAVMKQESAEIANNVLYAGNSISVKKESDKLTISSVIDKKELKRIFYLNESQRNGCSNFYDDYLDGSKIKEARDDIAPQRFNVLRDGVQGNWTVGANHGWPCFVVSGTSLTSADVGSVWSNGTNQFVVFSVNDSGTVIFLYPCTMSDNKPSFTTASVTGTFAHVSGGSYTTSFTVTNPSVLQNLYPSINNRSVSMFVGNDEITTDGLYSGETCTIVEQYSIVDYSDLIAKLTAQGTDFDIDTVGAFATIVNGYEFRGNVCNVTQTIIANHNLVIGDSGILQATTILENSGAVYAYCNHVASGTLASSGLVTMSGYNTSNYATASNAESGKVPNRFVQINKADGVARYAFIMGFYPDKSDGADSKRAELSTFMEIRDTQKMYPYCIYQKSLSAGDSVTVAGFRAYQGASDIVADCIVKTQSGEYVLMDAQETGMLTVLVSGKTGATFEIVDSSGFTTHSDVVGAKGINVSVSGDAQSGTFKIT